MVRENITTGVSALLVLGGVACSSDPEVPEQPYPTATASAQQPPPQPPPPPEPTVQTGPCDATMQVAMQAAVEERAKKELDRGLEPESTFTCQLVAEGEKVSVPVTINQGQCVAVLAHSYPNITDLDVFLKPNLGPNPNPILAPIANAVLAQDSEQGPVGSIGSGPNSCYKNAFPIPVAAVAEVQVKAGSGPVALQVYKK